MKKTIEYKGGVITRIDTSAIKLTEKDKSRIQLQINNPSGNNKYTPKSELKPKPKDVEVTKEMDIQAYREKLIARNEYLSKAQTYAFIHKKFCGYDKIDEEFKVI